MKELCTFYTGTLMLIYCNKQLSGNDFEQQQTNFGSKDCHFMFVYLREKDTQPPIGC